MTTGGAGGAKAFKLRSQASTSCVFVEPPVAPVKPIQAWGPVMLASFSAVCVSTGDAGFVVLTPCTR